MASLFTPNKNLYKWQTTDLKQTTITEMGNNMDKLDTELSDNLTKTLESTGYGVITGLIASAQVTPNMTVSVASGTVHMPDGKRFTPTANTSLAINAADSTKPRTDIAYVNSAGVISYLASGLGTAAVPGSRTHTITTNAVANDTVIIEGVTFTAVASGATGNQFNIGADTTATATNLTSTLSANTTINAKYTATSSTNVITLTEKTAGGGNTPSSATKTGTIVISSGTAITSTAQIFPSAPSIPAGGVSLAEIKVGAGVTTIVSGNITDTRFMKQNNNQLTSQLADIVQINLKQYGCKLDGVTDDTTKFQQACDSLINGGTIFLSSGTCLITSPITIKYSGVSIIGNDIRKTIIKYNGITTPSIIKSSGSLQYNNIKNITIEANNLGGYGIDFTGFAYGQLENVMIKGSTTGTVLLSSSRNAYFDEPCVYNKLRNVRGYNTTPIPNGFRIMDGANSNYLYNCESTNANTAFSIEDEVNFPNGFCNNNVLIGCSSEPSNSIGFYINSESNTIIAPRLENWDISPLPIGIKFGTGIKCQFNLVINPTFFSVTKKYDGINSSKGNIIFDASAGGNALKLFSSLSLNPSTGNANISLIPNNGGGYAVQQMGNTKASFSVEADDNSYRVKSIYNSGFYTAFSVDNSDTPSMTPTNDIKTSAGKGIQFLQPDSLEFVPITATNAGALLSPKGFDASTYGGRGLTVLTPDGTKKYKISVDNNGNIISSLIP